MVQARVLDTLREQGAQVDPADLRRALALFEPVWEVLHFEEQTRVLRLLIESISVSGAAGTAVIAFRPTGIQGLAAELAPRAGGWPCGCLGGHGGWRRGCARGATRATDGPDAPAAPAPDRIPRVARVLALAHHWQGLIRTGVVRNRAELAELVGVSRARVAQVMRLLWLAPKMQERVLLNYRCAADCAAVEHDLRSIAAEPLWAQRRWADGPWRPARG